MDKNTSAACGDFCVFASYVLYRIFWGGKGQGQYVWTKWQPGESTPPERQLQSLPSHQTVRILVHVVVIEVIEDFLIFFCLFFLLQNVVELQKSLLVVDVVEKAQQPDIETK